MAELGQQELQIQKGEVEAYPFRVEVEECQGLQEMEGVEGFQHHQEEGEGEVAFLVLQAREEGVWRCKHPQAKESRLRRCNCPQVREGEVEEVVERELYHSQGEVVGVIC